VAAALVLLSLAVPAHADTDLLGSSPVHGSTVTSRPTSVTLDFQDRIVGQPVVAVTGPDGARIDAGAPLVVDTRVQQPIEPTTNGEYAVVFRVVAADGHPVKGALTFVLDAPDEPGFWADYGIHVVGFGVVLLLAVVVAALSLRPTTAPRPTTGGTTAD
jgi:methionine-rich copper-binding protein CopC